MTKNKIKNYVFLHLSILLFSFTSVFTKMASNEFNKNGIYGIGLYVFLFLMLLNCFVYALVWQKVIKRFDLNVAYANKSVYLIWSQVWAVLIFHENLTAENIIGLILVFIGVLVVQEHE
ncbi:MAG: EamA family transporter [Eubacteriales bacterium]|nr:EamA family transporter [Eubacteriales bacterium]